MDDKYMKFIETIAAKLGTTVEHLWGVLIRQAPINGFVDIVQLVVLVIATIWYIKIVDRKTRSTPQTPVPEWDEAAPLAWFSAFICALFALLCIIVSIQDIVSAFANPEYWALKQLIH